MKSIRRRFRNSLKERDTTKTFAYGVAETIKEYLPPEYQDYKITVEERVKNNNVVQVGIQVNAPEDNVSPIIYMESFFDEIKSGEPVDQVMENIASVIRDCRGTISTDTSVISIPLGPLLKLRAIRNLLMLVIRQSKTVTEKTRAKTIQHHTAGYIRHWWQQDSRTQTPAITHLWHLWQTTSTTPHLWLTIILTAVGAYSAPIQQ